MDENVGVPPPPALALLGKSGFCRRLWARDPSLWPGDPDAIRNRLGWLALHEKRPEARELKRFASELRDGGFRQALLLGMGGSSLFPEVLARTPRQGLDMVVLDSTAPSAIRAAEERLDLSRTLVIVSSKSGTTLETLSLTKHFASRIPDKRQFVAITDPGSPLEGMAEEQGFRRVFAHPADVGGRYSALSAVGLLPAALIGIDPEELLEGAARMARASEAPEPESPGVRLGAVLADAALAGRDKLMLSGPLGPWIEQLVAESTGKDGKGIIPVEGEPPGTRGSDRLLLDPPEPDLGSACLLWELAVATAGNVLGINPFDQPDVEGSKELTRKMLAGGIPEPPPGDLKALLAGARPGDYLALLAWLPRTAPIDAELQGMRTAARDAIGLATTLGYGPRYLHSTGQLHKGGADRGLFLLLTCDEREDLPVPGEAYTFGALLRCQAQGDFLALQRRGRRAVRCHLGRDPLAGLRALRRRLDAALGDGL